MSSEDQGLQERQTREFHKRLIAVCRENKIRGRDRQEFITWAYRVVIRYQELEAILTGKVDAIAMDRGSPVHMQFIDPSIPEEDKPRLKAEWIAERKAKRLLVKERTKRRGS